MRLTFVGLLTTGILVGCADTSGDIASTPSSPSSVIECQLGCQETDPFPDSAGVFLGSGVTSDECYGSGQTDNDGDNLSTFCENNLAAAFAPELYYSSVDEIGREPYWVARPINADTIKIGYLISYYRDAGSSVSLCNLPPPLWDPSCEGHNGDSEAIFLKVYYKLNTKHWVLTEAKYSQHTSYYITTRGAGVYPTSLVYPSHPGAYPRSYVAEGKHGNYRSVSSCNSGGTLGTDTCTHVNTAARVASNGAYNLGSHITHLVDCVASRDPAYFYYGSGRQECYWTTTNFRGWIPTYIGGAESDPYSSRLTAEGF